MLQYLINSKFKIIHKLKKINMNTKNKIKARTKTITPHTVSLTIFTIKLNNGTTIYSKK